MLNSVIKVVAPITIGAMLLIVVAQTINVDRQIQIKPASSSIPQAVQKSPTNKPPTSTGQPTTPPPATTTVSANSDLTSNWAGYVASGGAYSAVSGSWVVPQASNTTDSTAADATWVGIGGMNSDDLIQVGTQDVVSAGGQLSATAFYELLPYNAQSLGGVSVDPGDSISASISQVGSGEWDVTLTDNTNGSTYTNMVYYDSSESSAEWIEEDPSDGVGQIPFDNFGSVSFSDCSTTDNGQSANLTASAAQSLTMVNNQSQALTTTSPISSTGSGFAVSRTAASSNTGGYRFEDGQGSGISPGDPLGRWGHFGFGAY
jgi:Peptidase A4 family